MCGRGAAEPTVSGGSESLLSVSLSLMSSGISDRKFAMRADCQHKLSEPNIKSGYCRLNAPPISKMQIPVLRTVKAHEVSWYGLRDWTRPKADGGLYYLRASWKQPRRLQLWEEGAVCALRRTLHGTDHANQKCCLDSSHFRLRPPFCRIFTFDNLRNT